MLLLEHTRTPKFITTAWRQIGGGAVVVTSKKYILMRPS